jgi:hypothetical protein
VTSAVRDGSVNIVVDNYRAFDARVITYASAERGLHPSLDLRYGHGPVPSFDWQAFDRSNAADREALRQVLDADGLPPELLGDSRFAARIEQTVNDGGDSASWGLALGTTPATTWIYGVTDLVNPRRVRVVSPPETRFLTDEDLSLANVSGYHDRIFGAGWHRPERGLDTTGEFRWASTQDANLLLPIAGPARDLHLTLTAMARSTDTDPQRSITLIFNDLELEPCRLEAGWVRCTWLIPASHVREGANHSVVRSSSVGRPSEEGGGGDSRQIGHAVRQIMLRR